MKGSTMTKIEVEKWLKELKDGIIKQIAYTVAGLLLIAIAGSILFLVILPSRLEAIEKMANSNEEKIVCIQQDINNKHAEILKILIGRN